LPFLALPDPDLPQLHRGWKVGYERRLLFFVLCEEPDVAVLFDDPALFRPGLSIEVDFASISS